MPHHRVWKFHPPPGHTDTFERAYAADGAWSALFQRAEGYIGTRLLRSAQTDGWWMTIDSWTDEPAFHRFQAEFGDDYQALDRQLEGVAGEECFVGAFDD